MRNAEQPEGNAMRTFARALAPYLKEELARLDSAQGGVDPNYDAQTCARYVSELGTGVLKRSLVLFRALALDGRMDSLVLSSALGCRPPAISGSLTTPLKRRATKLGLPLPFDGGQGSLDFGGVTDHRPGDDPGRTYWADRNGIAARIVQAITDELAKRP
jgi:hypothetical protein